MMKQKPILSIVLMSLLMLVLNISSANAQGQPRQPSTFWGIVTVNGSPVPAGTAVRAWIAGTQSGQAATQTVSGQSWYTIDVTPGNPGDTVEFQVDGQAANESGEWELGGSEELNLTVAPDSLDVVANFTCTPTSGQPPLEITCNDGSTGDITSWQWDFGDGTTSSEQNPAAHTYANEGSYTVSLTVTGPNGSDSHTVSISVSDLPQCDNLANDQACASATVGGSLWVTWQNILFPSTNMTGEDVLVETADQTWQAADGTGDNEGWNIILHAPEDFTSEQGYTIPVDGFSAWCSDVSPVGDNTDSTDPPICQSSPGSLAGQVNLLSAATGTGTGTYDFVPHFQLLIPGTTIGGTYQTTVEVTMGVGP